MIMLPRRLCGTPRPGLYATGMMGQGGTLSPFTAIAAPVEATIHNPRCPEIVHIRETLCAGLGLVPPGPGLDHTPFASLPTIGLADLWGRSAGYETVADVIDETVALGISRRISKVPDVSLPCPVLMMHMDTVVTPASPFLNWEGLLCFDSAKGAPDSGFETDVLSQPWRDARSLGRVGDPRFLQHWYVGIWKAVRACKGVERKKFLADCGARLKPGIFGLSWITAFVQVLEPDQKYVDPDLAEQGVIPALAPDDPRAVAQFETKEE